MTPEEKAKRYDKLAKEVKDFFEGKQKMHSDITQTLEHLFPELKESEGERIRKAIISGMTAIKSQGKETFATVHINDCIAWLEKQGDYNRLVKEIKERKELFSKEKEKVTSTNDKLSLGGRIAILEELLAFTKEKQGEQKPQGKSALEAINEEKVNNANKDELKFKVGYWITDGKHNRLVIGGHSPLNYMLLEQDGNILSGTIENIQHTHHLWSIKDAKDADILVYEDSIFIFNEIHENWLIYYGIYENDKFRNDKCYSFLDLDTIDINNIHPATKEQRDTLMKAMADAGYAFDFEKKELKKNKDETSIAVNNPDAYKIGFADGEAHAKEEQWKPSDEQIKHLTYVVYDAKHKNDIYTYGYEPYFHLSNLLMQLKKLKG